MAKIIISYRRADTQDMAMRIRDRLADHFGRNSVLTDIDNIPIGSDFLAYINAEISTCDILLAVVGPRWLRIHDEAQADSEDAVDYVRLEIEAAFREQIRVVPVTVNGGRMPKRSELPESISAFALRNAATVDSGINFQNDMDRLVRSLSEYVSSKRGPMDSRTHAASAPVDTRPQPMLSLAPVGETLSAVPGTGMLHPLAAFNAARKSVPAVDFALGASAVAMLAALILGFTGHSRASLFLFLGMLIALVSVMAGALLMSNQNATVTKIGFSSIWIVALLFIGFLTVSATAIGLKWPAGMALLMGFEVEDPICTSPLAVQEAYSCNAGGDWVVVGIPLDDSDRVTLTIRDKPLGTPLEHIGPTSIDVGVDQCENNWCRVQCGRVAGWARQKYLSRRAAQLRATVGTPGDPDGVGIRAGPHRSCRARGAVPPARNVILHGCEKSPADQFEWCRITYNGISGWIPQTRLELSR